MKVQICDVVVRCEDRDLPDACPKCGKPITGERALRVWEYADRRCPVDVDGAGNLTWGLSQAGDESFPVEYRCGACDYVLLSGIEEIHGADMFAPRGEGQTASDAPEAPEALAPLLPARDDAWVQAVADKVVARIGNKETRRKRVRIHLSAYKRVFWSAFVEVPDRAVTTTVETIGNAIYDELDADDFTEDPDYWDRGDVDWDHWDQCTPKREGE